MAEEGAKKGSFLDKIQDALDQTIEKNMPKGEAAKRTNWWLGTCALTVATGLYTGIVDWNPVVRTVAHLAGAAAIPAGGAFVASLAMNGIESLTNAGIDLYNKKHPEKAKEHFKINKKTRDIVKVIASAVVGATYAYATLGTEVDQFRNSGIFQAHQYAADIGGVIAGTAAFGKLELNEAAASFMNKVNVLSNTVVKPINKAEEKIKSIFRGKDEHASATLDQNELLSGETLVIEQPKQDPLLMGDLGPYIRQAKSNPSQVRTRTTREVSKNDRGQEAYEIE